MFLSQIWDILTWLNVWIPIGLIWISSHFTFASLRRTTLVSVDTRDRWSSILQLSKRTTILQFTWILRKTTNTLSFCRGDWTTIVLILLARGCSASGGCSWLWNVSFVSNLNSDHQIIYESKMEKQTATCCTGLLEDDVRNKTWTDTSNTNNLQIYQVVYRKKKSNVIKYPCKWVPMHGRQDRKMLMLSC